MDATAATPRPAGMRPQEAAAAILESITDAFFALDRDWRFRYLNAQAERQMQRSGQDLLGQRIWDIFPDVGASAFGAAMRRAMDQRQRGTADAWYSPDARWYEMRTYPAPEGIAVYYRDVTEERQAEAQMQQAGRERRLYEAILTNTPDLAYVFDRQHRFIYANEVLLKMWSKTWDEAIGKTCLELGYEPWHAEMHDREIEQVVATRQPVRGVVPFNGSFGRRMYDYIFVPVFNAQGEVEAVAGTTRDVTEAQESEQKLQRLADELAEADRRKTEFLAMLAHELRNPLAPMRNAAEIIRRNPAHAPGVLEAADILQRQIGQMVRLVDDLMDVSRISHGRIGLQLEPTDLASVLGQAMESARPMIEAASQELSLQLPSGFLPLQADTVRLTQVFSNLLNNASKYSKPGARILLEARQEGRELRIAVRDQGIGIAPAALPGIFDMFTQVDRSLERPRSGLGIGLALVKTLVELHGGRVEGHSEGLGQGSEFRVWLPMAALPEEAVTATSTPATVSGRRVLVVDDNVDAAQTLGQLLELLGNEIRLAHDGQAGVDAAAEFQPELILMDIGLPQLNGYEACRRIRSQIQGRRPVIIALTGWGQEQDRAQSAEAGFDSHLVKPVKYDTLMQLAASLLPAA
ncbi:PAS domain-containing protein [Solimonas sp. SE-A11]|uniref:hybrid sensor histidine kinase/response regulator n=1 Tax=Solimonas sp. SE-A11 TaxID=3054954 RepID=UPI00259CBA86|nr:PAS domain-containing protein [Solimonas sp. SE-A11]MDM4772707.1 PAS domain-containing protein [Solimonas sp. SE-A11]